VIVADATLIVSFTVRHDQSDLADAVCEADPVWVAPLLWRSEFCTALVKCLQFAGMTLDSARLALQSAEEVMGGREYRVSSEQVLELAARSKCTAAECEYVALAMDLGVPLVTSDRQLLREFPEIAVSMKDFAFKNEPEIKHHRHARRSERRA
jgi:predicted nucleic acid-binding protein